MLGGLGCAVLHEAGTPLWAAAPTAITATAAVGALLDLVVVRRARDADGERLIILTIGASVTLEGAALLVFGPDSHFVPSFSEGRAFEVFGAHVVRQYVWCGVATGVAVLLMWLFLTRTLWGTAMRATAMEPEAVRLVGVSCGPDEPAGVHPGRGARRARRSVPGSAPAAGRVRGHPLRAQGLHRGGHRRTRLPGGRRGRMGCWSDWWRRSPPDISAASTRTRSPTGCCSRCCCCGPPGCCAGRRWCGYERVAPGTRPGRLPCRRVRRLRRTAADGPRRLHEGALLHDVGRRADVSAGHGGPRPRSAGRPGRSDLPRAGRLLRRRRVHLRDPHRQMARQRPARADRRGRAGHGRGLCRGAVHLPGAGPVPGAGDPVVRSGGQLPGQPTAADRRLERPRGHSVAGAVRCGAGHRPVGLLPRGRMCCWSPCCPWTRCCGPPQGTR